MDSGVLTIPGKRTKSRRSLVLTLRRRRSKFCDPCRGMMRQDFAFGKAGRAGFNAWSYCTIALNTRIAAATGRALPHWTLHDLRRSMRSGLGRLGVAPHVAELTIGHVKARRRSDLRPVSL